MHDPVSFCVCPPFPQITAAWICVSELLFFLITAGSSETGEEQEEGEFVFHSAYL